MADLVAGNSDAPAAQPEAPAAQPVTLVDARQSLGPAKLDDLFPAEDAFRRSLQTYIVLLALAGLISSFGLYQDSVASIIGAMVVAPLGGAIMAFAGALVTGRTRWQTISFLQVALGGLMVVGDRVSRLLGDAGPAHPDAGARGAHLAGPPRPRRRPRRRRCRRLRGGPPDGQRRAARGGDRGLARAAAGHRGDLPGAGPARRRRRAP